MYSTLFIKARFRLMSLCLLTSITSILLMGGVRQCGAEVAEVAQNEVLVGIRPEADNASAHSCVPKLGRLIAYHAHLHMQHLLLAPGVSMNATLATLRKRGDVLFAEPNHIIHVAATPNNPAFTNQWALAAVQANKAWSIWQPQATTIIAIVDSGIDSNHPDLTNKILRDANGVIGFDASTGQRSIALDGYGHGTHCAGIAAAQINGGNNVAGIAGWDGKLGDTDTTSTKLMPVKVLDNNGNGTDATVAAGIDWAADHGAKVISLSLGGVAYSAAMDAACQYAWSKGCVVVAAAGNNGAMTPFYPAANNHVVSVAATDSTDTLASFSDYGAWVSVAAPGVNIYSTLPTGGSVMGTGYGVLSGTSMATPLVAGEAALLWSQNSSLTNAQIIALIENNVDTVNPYLGRSIAQSAGRINAFRALQAVGANIQSIVASPLGLTADATTGQITLSWNPSFGAVTYNVKRSQKSGGPYIVVAANVSITGYVDNGNGSTGLTNGTAYYYIVTAVNSAGESGPSNEAIATPLLPLANSATLLKADTATQGSWKGIYGAQGSMTIGDSTALPAYVQVNPSGAGSWAWAAITTDTRGLQKVNSTTDRVGACLYASNLKIDVNLTDNQTHQIALYLCDWDHGARSERIDILDSTNNAVLSTQTLSSFAAGSYLVWNLHGHVIFKVTCLSGPNAVVDGLFVDAASGGKPSPPPAPTALTAMAGVGQVNLSWSPDSVATGYNVKRSNAPGGPYTTVGANVGGTSYIDTGLTGQVYYYVVTAVNPIGESANSNEASVAPQAPLTTLASFVKSDTVTGGAWKGVYGSNGYQVLGDSSSLPAFVTVAANNCSPWTWASSTADTRALLKGASTSDRVAACWYGGYFEQKVNITDGLTHKVAIYCVDWDGQGRTQHIDVVDAKTGTLLDSENIYSFTGGAYQVWNIRGNVRFQFTHMAGGDNAVMSGLFID